MKLIYITILAFVLIACNPPQRNCADFKTGSFEFTAEINGESTTTSFFRNDTLEVENFNGKIDSSSIKWVNDCEYILKNLHPVNTAEETPLLIKILTTSEDRYTFEYGQVGSAQKARGTAVKIK
mgnify:FL=1|jgi:hypothetical protein